MTRSLDRLFNGAKQYYAPLEGKEWTQECDVDSHYFSADSAHAALHTLNQHLQNTHPEAGTPYWRIRAWELSWWQPVSLALMCVYHLKMVPSTLSSIRQRQHLQHIAGYSLKDGEWLSSSLEQRIHFAAIQLKEIFQPLVSAHNQEFNGRVAFYKALLADLLMGYLTTATQTLYKNDTQRIQQDYQQWADALQLPDSPMTRLTIKDSHVLFHRKTCCLTFRCHNNTVCSNCPKQKTRSLKDHV